MSQETTNRGPNIFVRVFCGMSALILASAWQITIAKGEEKDTRPPIEYRRVFVPADNTAVWPRDGEKYLPVESRDFEAWIAAGSASSASQRPHVSITLATYWARWDGQQALTGRGEWTIALRGNGPGFVPLNEMSLVASAFRWQDATEHRVRYGAWGSSSANNAFGLEVSRSGVLNFEWHAAAKGTHDGIEVPWHLLPTTSNRLIIDLPEGKRPSLEGSVLVATTDTPDNPRPRAAEATNLSVGEESTAPNSSSTQGASAPMPMGAPADISIKPLRWRRWELLFDPESRANLRIVDEQAGALPTTPTLQLREDLNYQMTDRGLEFLAKLELTNGVTPHRELAVALPNGVQLISATIEGREIPWRVAGRTPMGESKAIVELPDFTATRSLTVMLRAWQGLVIDKPWQLPKLRPDNVFWSSGTMDLSIAAGLELESLTPTDCLQTAVKLADSKSDRLESLAFTSYAPNANVEVKLGRRPPDASARMGTAIQIGDPDVTTRLAVQLQIERGSIHRLTAQLEPGWLIEAVETIPAGALGKWHVDDENDSRTLELQLATSAQPKQSVTIFVTGRLQRPNTNEPLAAHKLNMLRWSDLKVSRNLAVINAVQPYNVETVGDLPAITPQSLSEEDRLLFVGPLDGPIFDLAKAGSDAAIRPTLEQNIFSADIQIDATLVGTELQQSYQILCSPKASRVDQLLVFASVPLGNGDEVSWTETLVGTRLDAERLAVDDPRIARFPAGGEFWLVRLKRPATTATGISVTRITPWQERNKLPLLALPDAHEQQGRITVRTVGTQAIFPEPSHLQAAALPIESADQSEPREAGRIQAMYRFEPAKCLVAEQQPSLWLRPNQSAETVPSITASRIDLESFVAADGSCTHRANYQLENRGANQLDFTLPTNIQLESADVDGNPIDLSTKTERTGKMSLPLPREARFVRLSLMLSSKIVPHKGVAELESPLPVTPMPVDGGYWSIWLPEDYRAVGEGLSHSNEAFSWRQRLFGPLGRPDGTRPFDLLRGFDWQTWLFDTAAEATAEASESQQPRELDGKELTPPNRPGWHVYHQTFMAGPPSAVELTQPALATAWSLVILLFAFVVGTLVRNWRLEWYIGLTASAAMLCIVLPTGLAPLATGAFGGLLLSLVAGWPKREVMRELPSQSWQRRGMATAVIVLVLLFARSLRAESPEVEALTPRPAPADGETDQIETPITIHSVLIPIDGSGEENGSKVYVSETLLRQLLRQASTESATRGQWLISNVACQGELIARPDAPGLLAGNWILKLSVEVFARDTTLVLPLKREEAAWTNTVMLDGIPTPVSWQADGKSCSINVSEPGRYELEISCVPKTHDLAGRGRIELAIPPLPGSTIQLNYPSAATILEVAGATHQQRGGTSTGILRSELDGSGQLVVDWPQEQMPTGSIQDRRITELQWLRVDANGVFLDVKYLVEGLAGSPDALTIAADPRWELAMSEDSVASLKVVSEPSGRRMIRVPVPAQDTHRTEISLRFRLAGGAVLGRLQIPSLELQSLPVAHSWLAVSNDDSLECEMLGNRDVTSGSADEFLNVWGDGQTLKRPHIVLANLPAGSISILAVHPRIVESEIDETLHIAAGTAALRVQYQANVIPSNTHRCQFTIAVPNELVINEITQIQAGRQNALRWVRSADNRIQVFFGSVVTDPYRLVLTGNMPVNQADACPLPRIVSASKDAASARIVLYREQETLVSMQGLEDRVEEQTAELPPIEWNARPFRAFLLDRTASEKVRLKISPNRPETVGDTLTSLTTDGNGWTTSFHARLAVKHGILDSLRLRIPSTWVGPFEVLPSTQAVVSVTPLDAHHSLLNIPLPKPIEAGQKLEIEIRGRLAPATAAAGVAVPNIVSETAAEWKRYIAVPKNSNLQSSVWAVSGADPAKLSPELSPAIAPVATDSFLVVSDAFRIALEQPQSVQPAASVRLVDTTVIAGTSGGQIVTTRFALAPQQLTECDIQLPEGQELMAVYLDSRPANVCAAEEGRCHVQLGPTQLPQWLEVVSHAKGEPTSKARVIELRRPTLFDGDKPLGVEMGLWSFCGTQKQVTVRVTGASQATALEHMATRLDRLVNIAESAIPAAAAAPAPDGYYWHLPWSERLTILRRNAQAFAKPMVEGTQIIADTSNTADEQLKKASQRVDVWLEQCAAVLVEPEGEIAAMTADGSSPNQWKLLEGSGEWIYCVADGGSDRLKIEFPPSGVTPAQARAGLLLAIVGLAFAAIWTVRLPAARDLFWRWPQVAGVLVGMAYWAWLRPSSLGLLIVAISLLMLFSGKAGGRAFQSDSSTVVRAGSRS